jgi:hypothetical protein
VSGKDRDEDCLRVTFSHSTPMLDDDFPDPFSNVAH